MRAISYYPAASPASAQRRATALIHSRSAAAANETKAAALGRATAHGALPGNAKRQSAKARYEDYAVRRTDSVALSDCKISLNITGPGDVTASSMLTRPRLAGTSVRSSGT